MSTETPRKLEPPERPLLTQSEYARHRKTHGLSGTTAASVSYAIRDGRIEFAPGTSLIDPKQADRNWANRTDARPSQVHGRTSAGADSDYNVSRADREYYEAELARLKVAERRGQLIAAEVVRKVLYEAARIIRAGHEDIVSQLAPDLASETDINAVERILKRRLERLDTDLANRIETLDELFRAEQSNGLPLKY